MEILRNTNGEYNIVLNEDLDFLTNLAWEENIKVIEDELIDEIVNPIDSYETVRFLHQPYSGITNNSEDFQDDLYYTFYFLDENNTYNNGLNYVQQGIEINDNISKSKIFINSFFRLEFYKTPNDELPTRINRKLFFTKDLPLMAGEKFFNETIKKYIRIPLFIGSTFKNKEIMYFYWLFDDIMLSDKSMNSPIFWLALKFYNAKTGNVIDFTNKPITVGEVNEKSDMYYKVEFDKNNTTYVISYDNNRVGDGFDNPIVFFERG